MAREQEKLDLEQTNSDEQGTPPTNLQSRSGKWLLKLPPWVGTLALICSIVSLPLSAMSVIDYFSRRQVAGYIVASLIIAAIIILIIIIVILLKFSFEQLAIISTEFQSRHRAENTLKMSSDILQFVHELNDKISQHAGPYSEQELAYFCKEISDRLAGLMESITGKRCRVCVKQIFHDASSISAPWVQAIARSGEPHPPGDRHEAHDLYKNIDFFEILNGDRAYWFNNDIENLGESYRTSRTHATLRYRSTIVWPIRQRATSTSQEHLPEFNQTPPSTSGIVSGYLCLDCKTPNVFLESRDVVLGWPASDAIARAMESAFSSHS